MKKVFIAITFILIAQMGMAQDAAFKADVLKVISMNGSDAQMKLVKNQILKMIPEANQAGFLKEFDASIPSLHDKMAKVYMEIYTPADIKGMITFYESPVGKKMSEKAGELGEKSMSAGQEWGQELQGIMMKYKETAPAQNTYSVSKGK